MAKRTLDDYYGMLARAHANLKEAFALQESAAGTPLGDLARDATVKRYELTYELLVKSMFEAAKRLPETEQDEAVVTWTVAHRTWRDMGVGTADLRRYNTFKKVRNRTTHTYDADVYEEYLDTVLPEFIREVDSVLTKLKPLLPHD